MMRPELIGRPLAEKLRLLAAQPGTQRQHAEAMVDAANEFERVFGLLCLASQLVGENEQRLSKERERCAAWVDCRRLEFLFRHANHDPHTGAVEFGRGPHAEAKAEYVGELEEIAEGLRALGPGERP